MSLIRLTLLGYSLVNETYLTIIIEFHHVLKSTLKMDTQKIAADLNDSLAVCPKKQ